VDDGSRRVAVTGLGAVSAWGWSVAALWRGLESGGTGIRAFGRFDASRHRTRVAAEVPPPPLDLPARLPEWRRSSWADRFALSAALEAVGAARLPDTLESLDAGVFFASSTGGMFECERYLESMLADPSRVEAGPRLSLLGSQQLNGPGDAVARALRVTGPVETVSSACASGSLSIAAGFEAVRRGEVSIAVTGGSDSLCQVTYAGFNALRAVDEGPCRPFRLSRAGLSLGEGAAVLVLEPLESALARGATVLAELKGAGASCDAHHMTAPHPQGEGAAAAMEEALRDGGLAPEVVDFVNAHGTGTPLNDAAEWGALRRVFGEGATSIPLVATKSVLGHLLGTAGAIEAVATILDLSSGTLHAAPSDGALDPLTPVDLVQGSPRRLDRARAAVSVNLAFGGSNAALLLCRWEGT
jgi:3-oxoacyl-[acyl-carrier-protein] synthase II